MTLRAPLALLLAALTLAPGSAAALEFEVLAASRADLSNPHDVKLSPDGAELFVGDVGNGRVAVLDAETLAFRWSFGGGHQAGSRDVDFDAQGRVYVADTYNHRVGIYRLDGRTATLTGQLDARVRGPEGVLVHPNGRVYVAGAWSNNLVAYGPDGAVVAELDGLNRPHDVELAADGAHLWLADSENDRLLLLTPDLTIRREISGPATGFDGPRYMDLADDGTLFVADKDNHQVKAIAPDGTLLATLGTGEPGKGPGLLTTPEGVELRGSTLWVADSGNDRIVTYRVHGLE